MKRFLLLTALPFLLTGGLKAQLPYNFSFAYIGTTPYPSQSIVKAYTPTSSVVYHIEFGDTSYGIISLVTTTGSVLSTKLPHYYQVQDMCIHGNTLYLLMKKADTKQYYIGWMDLNLF